jgi:hypothetical protein
MSAVWREGQDRMLDVFRRTPLSSLADRPVHIAAPAGAAPAASATIP